MQVKKIIEQHAVEPILITGEDYPAPAENRMLARILGFLQMALLSIIIAGSNICQTLGI